MSQSVQRIYVERAVVDHPRTQSILDRFPRAERVLCERYGEVFNRKAQSYRLQKRRPALILAEKFDHFFLETPSGYGIGGERNFYFSHMLNCVYDCRYCFLQGMYRSAHYVLFVNYGDFRAAIEREIVARSDQDSYFFSGYDCDSLALDSVTEFVPRFVPFFSHQTRGFLELRTKSTRIGSLLELEATPQCIVAFSFTPSESHTEFETGVPSVGSRLEAMTRLAERGWPLGLRFDPMMFSSDYARCYQSLFEQVFSKLPVESLHSVSFGPFRLPRGFYDRMYRLYPDEPLFAGPLDESFRMVSYGRDRERELLEFCAEELRRFVPEEIFFPCKLPGS